MCLDKKGFSKSVFAQSLRALKRKENRATIIVGQIIFFLNTHFGGDERQLKSLALLTNILRIEEYLFQL